MGEFPSSYSKTSKNIIDYWYRQLGFYTFDSTQVFIQYKRKMWNHNNVSRADNKECWCYGWLLSLVVSQVPLSSLSHTASCSAPTTWQWKVGWEPGWRDWLRTAGTDRAQLRVASHQSAASPVLLTWPPVVDASATAQNKAGSGLHLCQRRSLLQ